MNCRSLRLTRFLLASCAMILVSGCAGYNEQGKTTIAASKGGDIDTALASLESHNTSADKDLLYYMEKGELLRMRGDYADSRDSLMQADSKVRQWEEDAKTDPGKLLGDLGSVLLNDTTRRYDGRDYEKTMLSVRLALDHLALNDWDNARVEIRRMHEREAVIAEFRAKELEAARSGAEEKGLKVTSFKELNGYPVETLDDPDVRRLKNSWESAFANYLAGFVYEALGEPSLAAPGYRKAAEMVPNVPVLDNSLKNMDARIAHDRRGSSAPAGNKAGNSTRDKAAKKGGKTPAVEKTATPGVDTLIIVENGMAPAIESITLPIPLPINHNFIMTPLSWPVIRPDHLPAVSGVRIDDGKELPLALLTDTNLMARRALSDEMPGIITRTAIRAITRGVAQVALDKAADRANGNAGLVLGLISLVTKVTATVTEVADERIWRTLPGTFSVTRLSLSPGTHTIMVNGRQKEFTVAGHHAVVDFRLLDNALYVAQAGAPVAPATSATP